LWGPKAVDLPNVWGITLGTSRRINHALMSLCICRQYTIVSSYVYI
jgi:hypothetical protein